MTVRFAVLSDFHYDRSAICHNMRRHDLADLLLRRAVQRINALVKPDLTVVLGDLINNGSGPAAFEELTVVRSILDRLDAPLLAIPGNHDGDPRQFFGAFDAPPDWMDVGNVRLVPFVDQDMPDFNAYRAEADLERMRAARVGWGGQLVSLQHVPVFPPVQSQCPYHYTNAADLQRTMHDCDYRLAVSGHFHEGIPLLADRGAYFTACPSLVEDPFGFLVITLEDNGRVTRECQSLKMPAHLGLVDCHVHTQFAYCSTNMDVERTLQLIPDLGLRDVVFVEHSGQLYFDADTFWSGAFLEQGVDTWEGRHERMSAYWQTLAAHGVKPRRHGLEVDCDFRGRPVLMTQDRRRARYLLGATHWLQASLAAARQQGTPDADLLGRELLALLETFLPSGLDVLAHPFRVFYRNRVQPPPALFPRLVRLLREHEVAVELNFHTQQPSDEFVTQCLEGGVKLVLGSDAHSLHEVGDLAPHLAFLRKLGVTHSDLSRVLRGEGGSRRIHPRRI